MIFDDEIIKVLTEKRVQTTEGRIRRALFRMSAIHARIHGNARIELAGSESVKCLTEMFGRVLERAAKLKWI